MDIIKVSHLVKEYKKIKKEMGLKGAVKNLFVQDAEYVRAVDDISFEIEKGDIVAYIGPNGAGKSTTVKMLSGIMRPTSGEILINSISPQKERKRVVKNLGVVFGQRSQLNWNLRLGETFELLKRIYQIDGALYEKNIKMLDEIFQFREFMVMGGKQCLGAQQFFIADMFNHRPGNGQAVERGSPSADFVQNEQAVFGGIA